MENFQCKKCGYMFKSELVSTEKCPYCGENSVIREPVAEDLLNEL